MEWGIGESGTGGKGGNAGILPVDQLRDRRWNPANNKMKIIIPALHRAWPPCSRDDSNRPVIHEGTAPHTPSSSSNGRASHPAVILERTRLTPRRHPRTDAPHTPPSSSNGRASHPAVILERTRLTPRRHPRTDAPHTPPSSSNGRASHPAVILERTRPLARPFGDPAKGAPKAQQCFRDRGFALDPQPTLASGLAWLRMTLEYEWPHPAVILAERPHHHNPGRRRGKRIAARVARIKSERRRASLAAHFTFDLARGRSDNPTRGIARRNAPNQDLNRGLAAHYNSRVQGADLMRPTTCCAAIRPAGRSAERFRSARSVLAAAIPPPRPPCRQGGRSWV